MDHEILDRLQGYAKVMYDDMDTPGWISAWETVLSFVKQERIRLSDPSLAAVPVGYEQSNTYIIGPASFSELPYPHAEE